MRSAIVLVAAYMLAAVPSAQAAVTFSCTAQIMGDGSAGTFAPSDSGTVTAGQVYQVTGSMYGFMPPSQDVPAGSYSDSIVVTVTY
jgi:spore coat protein U-like protein